MVQRNRPRSKPPGRPRRASLQALHPVPVSGADDSWPARRLWPLVGGYHYISQDLPKINSLMDYRPPIITTVYAEDGRKIAEFFKERRIVIPLSEVPPLLVNAFVAAEDSRFFQHQGVDPFSILRAALKNLEAGTIKQGGSTITQQVTRSFLLTPERSYIRKIKEVILSYRIEKAFTKEEILFLYLNQIYLGHGAYGVQAAAENYFGKSVKDLSLAECAVLAGLPQAPTRYSPFRHPEQARAAPGVRAQPHGRGGLHHAVSRPTRRSR
ncbi:MAG: transglycosylase domain-containing protein [Desulfobacterales bacterium]|nr:transglycosylase domain-containing protein [Desulfobacterales bacterium]